MSLQALQVGSVWLGERAGGGDRVFADLAKYLPSNGIGLEALVAGPAHVDEPLDTTLSTFGEITDGTRSRWFGARKAIAQRLDRGGVDLLASHFALYASAAMDRLRRQPFVVHFHGPWAAESQQEGAGRLSVLAKWSIERTVYRSAVRFVVLSNAFGRLATEQYNVPASLIRVVPGAADLERFSVSRSRTDARRALGWPTDRRVLVCVRRLVHRTGVDRLIEAMPTVKALIPDVRLFVGGKGPLMTQLERRISELELNECVTLLGYVSDDDLPLMYRAADLNVIPTIALEGFGLTAVEALAAGTASLVTPIGGLPEILGPLAPELVLPSTRVEDIARGLVDALSGRVQIPDETECRAFAVERFSAQLMASRVAEVYREVCA